MTIMLALTASEASWARLFILENRTPPALACQPAYAHTRDRRGKTVSDGFQIVAIWSGIDEGLLGEISVDTRHRDEQFPFLTGSEPGCVQVWIPVDSLSAIEVVLRIHGEERDRAYARSVESESSAD